MPDTRENQAAYPQPVVQQPGIGFPLARITGSRHRLGASCEPGRWRSKVTLGGAVCPSSPPDQLSRNTTFFSMASRPMCSLLAGKSGSG